MKTDFIELINPFIKKLLGVKVQRIKQVPSSTTGPTLKMKYVHDPVLSYMVDQKHKDRLIAELSLDVDIFKSENLIPSNSDCSSSSIVNDFFRIYSSRKLTDNTHGSGFHTAFWLYTIARIFDPELIVESGVWKGHSSWLLSQACPNADQYGFDISLNNVEISEQGIQMFEQDWQSFTFPKFNPDRALIFFDCHVNHAQRIIEAKAKGFKHILFDDNPPIHKLYSFIPGIPTAAMLAAGEGIDNTEISWVWNGQSQSEPIDLKEAQQAKELIKKHYTLPDVGSLTRYGGFAFLTYVQI